MISRNYGPSKINRPSTLDSAGNIRDLGGNISQGIRSVAKTVAPAARTAGIYLAKEAAKTGTSVLPTIGKGVGLAAGVGLSALTGNLETLPYLGAGGAYLGSKGGKYLQEEANKSINKWA